MSVQLIARQVVHYAGRHVQPGDHFLVDTHQHAVLLKTIGWADDAPPTVLSIDELHEHSNDGVAIQISASTKSRRAPKRFDHESE